MDYIEFGDVARKQLHIQCQYGIRYVATCGHGLRFRNMDEYATYGNYHAVEIHRDDVAEFVRRVNCERMTDETF